MMATWRIVRFSNPFDLGCDTPLPDRGVVVWRATGGIDAIEEYSHHLVNALRSRGVSVAYVGEGLRGFVAREAWPTWVLLQYNPFRYGRWGFAPGLIRDALRLHQKNVPLAIMVHEAWVPMTGWRQALMGLWQRAQLRILLRLADCLMASTEALASELGHGAVHLPIAANISPTLSSPSAARDELGLDDGLVVATFGRAHETRALDIAESAISAIVASLGIGATTVLNLGADAPRLDLPPQVRVRNLGRASTRDLSLHLWASDLVLLPFTDGVSTRRSTLMAALAHGRAVIGLCGQNTDSILIEHPEAMALAPVGDIDGYIDAAVDLATNPPRRKAMGDAGRRLYEKQFDWPQVAGRTIAMLDAITASRPGTQGFPA